MNVVVTPRMLLKAPLASTVIAKPKRSNALPRYQQRHTFAAETMETVKKKRLDKQQQSC
jgi:hypothetical protein